MQPATLMKILLPLAALALVTMAFATPPAPKSRKPHLTPARLADLAGNPSAEPPKSCTVEVSEFPAATMKLGNRVVLEKIREFRYPTEFQPAQGSGKPGDDAVTPTTPIAFETTSAGWSVDLTVKTRGKVFDVSGLATFTTVELVNGGYGELAGPIHSEDGKLLSPNVIMQPKIQTSTTRFHLYALPGQPYEILFYRGDKVEKRTITVTGALDGAR